MTPQEALVAIVRERDIDALVIQPEMLRGHLMDYCRGGNRREFNLLVTACQSRVPQVLRAPSSSVLQVDRIADLARRMVDDHGIGDEHARWAVGTWALALGVSTAPVTDLRPSDPVRRQVPERVHPVGHHPRPWVSLNIVLLFLFVLVLLILCGIFIVFIVSSNASSSTTKVPPSSTEVRGTAAPPSTLTPGLKMTAEPDKSTPAAFNLVAAGQAWLLKMTAGPDKSTPVPSFERSPTATIRETKVSVDGNLGSTPVATSGPSREGSDPSPTSPSQRTPTPQPSRTNQPVTQGLPTTTPEPANLARSATATRSKDVTEPTLLPQPTAPPEPTTAPPEPTTAPQPTAPPEPTTAPQRTSPPEPTAVPTSARTVGAVPTDTRSRSPSPAPTDTRLPSPSPAPTDTRVPTPTVAPTETRAPTPTTAPTNTRVPTQTPVPTATVDRSPTIAPTVQLSSPTLSSPSNGARIIKGQSATIAWSSVSRASGYQVEISNEDDPNAGGSFTVRGTSHTYTFGSGGFWNLRVRALGADGQLPGPPSPNVRIVVPY